MGHGSWGSQSVIGVSVSFGHLRRRGSDKGREAKSGPEGVNVTVWRWLGLRKSSSCFESLVRLEGG